MGFRNTLVPGVTYEWRVTAMNDFDKSVGLGWRFTTERTAGAAFVRGDCDGDGIVRGVVSDAVFQFMFSFLNGPAPRCGAACDSNGDAVIAGDAVHTLTFNFLNGPPPVPPFPACGPGDRPSDAELGCTTPRFLTTRRLRRVRPPSSVGLTYARSSPRTRFRPISRELSWPVEV